MVAVLSPVGLVSAVFSAPAGAAGCAQPKGVYTDTTPWAQRRLDLADLAAVGTGSGQTVAVIGTGIDAANPQFRAGQVLPGRDLLGGAGASGPAVTDCDGRGTFAAGIIGAQPQPHTTVVGVAPGVRLLPIRYTQSTDGQADTGAADRLAAALDAAQVAAARIALVAVPVTVDSAALRSAVSRFQQAGGVIVSPAAAAKAGQHSYPTSYPGVVAVAGVNSTGAAVTVESGGYLSVSAPGNDLVGLAAGGKGKLGHLWPSNDPSFAAAYVAGVIADVAGYRPRLTLVQVVARVLATAGGSVAARDDRVGWGLVDPVRAMTAELPDSVDPASMARPVAAGRPVALGRVVPGRGPAARGTGALALAALGLALLIGLAARTIGRGRGQGWQPRRVQLPAPDRASRPGR